MVTNENKVADVEPIIGPFVRFWSDYAEQTNQVYRQLFGGLEDGSGLKSWQRKWMDALSESADAYMRTPAFLQMMKQHNDAVVKLKSKSDDLASELARNANIPTAGDISGLFERLKCIEQTILDRLKSIEDRLGGIETGVGNKLSVKS
jgi:hypothetical protein